MADIYTRAKKTSTNSGIDTMLDHRLDFRMIIPVTKEKAWKREKIWLFNTH